MFDYDYNCYEDNNEVKEKIDILQIHFSQILNFVFPNITKTLKGSRPYQTIFSPECGGDVAGSVPTAGIA